MPHIGLTKVKNRFLKPWRFFVVVKSDVRIMGRTKNRELLFSALPLLRRYCTGQGKVKPMEHHPKKAKELLLQTFLERSRKFKQIPKPISSKIISN